MTEYRTQSDWKTTPAIPSIQSWLGALSSSPRLRSGGAFGRLSHHYCSTARPSTSPGSRRSLTPPCWPLRAPVRVAFLRCVPRLEPVCEASSAHARAEGGRRPGCKSGPRGHETAPSVGDWLVRHTLADRKTTPASSRSQRFIVRTQDA